VILRDWDVNYTSTVKIALNSLVMGAAKCLRLVILRLLWARRNEDSMEGFNGLMIGPIVR
jgi:hypothetical protein